jgi:hypothetical protein
VPGLSGWTPTKGDRARRRPRRRPAGPGRDRRPARACPSAHSPARPCRYRHGGHRDPYGTDLLLTDDGDFSVTPAGQLALLSGPLNCAQALDDAPEDRARRAAAAARSTATRSPRPIIGTKASDPTLLVSAFNAELRRIFEDDRRFLKAEKIDRQQRPRDPTRTQLSVELVLAGGDRLTGVDVDRRARRSRSSPPFPSSPRSPTPTSSPRCSAKTPTRSPTSCPTSTRTSRAARSTATSAARDRHDGRGHRVDGLLDLQAARGVPASPRSSASATSGARSPTSPPAAAPARSMRASRPRSPSSRRSPSSCARTPTSPPRPATRWTARPPTFRSRARSPSRAPARSASRGRATGTAVTIPAGWGSC